MESKDLKLCICRMIEEIADIDSLYAIYHFIVHFTKKTRN